MEAKITIELNGDTLEYYTPRPFPLIKYLQECLKVSESAPQTKNPKPAKKGGAKRGPKKTTVAKAYEGEKTLKPKDVTDKQLLKWYREVKEGATITDIVEREGLLNNSQLSNMFYSARQRNLFKAIDEEFSHAIEEEEEHA